MCRTGADKHISLVVSAAASRRRDRRQTQGMQKGRRRRAGAGARVTKWEGGAPRRRAPWSAGGSGVVERGRRRCMYDLFFAGTPGAAARPHTNKIALGGVVRDGDGEREGRRELEYHISRKRKAGIQNRKNCQTSLIPWGFALVASLLSFFLCVRFIGSSQSLDMS